MATIKCPRCGQNVSDQAPQCPFCGYPIHKTGPFCTNCGCQLSFNDTVCPRCGQPTLLYPPVRPRKKTGKIISKVIVSIILFAAVIFFGLSVYEDYFLDEIQVAFDGPDAENMALNENAEMLFDVWRNSMFQIRDPETDPFTCPEGKFIEDFNISLELLYQDPDFLRNLQKINEQQILCRKAIRKLDHAPWYMEDWAELTSLAMNNYVEVAQIVMYPSGSYTDLLERFNELCEESNSIFSELESLQ